MKINTDGVLIGSACCQNQPKNILDIGTGTGVIALMLAQRYKNATIDAVEIDHLAAETAKQNAAKSPFSSFVKVYNCSYEDFNTDKKYDLIVSNPPFFVNDLKNEEERKGIARHADEDFFAALIHKSYGLLSDVGSIWLILPLKQANDVIGLAASVGLHVIEKVHIYSDKTKPEIRQIICLSKQNDRLNEYDFYIYESLRVHTAQYKRLLADFFLAF
ncbi:tRNA1(Val) (adenine(37)-N6)-methyltransferase [Pedobacter jejuensis]|uniref:Methyltransferase domain-containing protein n=1 Tax=Pedobacter jejuensis TaxID=1268550 RepID=A0A3N0BVA7_9SPHI|nr:methyltransferase [Pedobacter jejuensis]RNL53359.1 methyltransferase domain-containing protein [Pedobacter jejuensis]